MADKGEINPSTTVEQMSILLAAPERDLHPQGPLW